MCRPAQQLYGAIFYVWAQSLTRSRSDQSTLDSRSQEPREKPQSSRKFGDAAKGTQEYRSWAQGFMKLVVATLRGDGGFDVRCRLQCHCLWTRGHTVTRTERPAAGVPSVLMVQWRSDSGSSLVRPHGPSLPTKVHLLLFFARLVFIHGHPQLLAEILFA